MATGCGAEGDSPEDHVTETCDDDVIKDTVFSKAWLLSLLVKLVSAVDSNKEGVVRIHPHLMSDRVREEEIREEEVRENDVREEEVREEELREKDLRDEGALDETIENDLCLLWDLTVNKEVILFLNEYEGVELITGVLIRSANNRLSEICLGVLNNMVYVCCSRSFSSSTIITTVISLLAHNDSQLLVECTRLVVTCLSHDQVRQYWLKELDSSTVLTNITFILLSSRNCDLLKNISDILDIILYTDIHILSIWGCSIQLIQAICESIDQCKSTRFDVMCSFMISLQLFTTVECGVNSIMKCSHQVFGQIVSFLKCLSERESNESKDGLLAGISLCTFMIETEPALKDMLLSENINYLHQLIAKQEVISDNTIILANKLLVLLN